MKLRSILLVLSLLAFLSASVGGFLYYSALKESAFKEADRQALSRLEMIQKNLASFISENIKPVRALAGMDALLNKLTHPKDRKALDSANAILDHFKMSLEAEVCYLMNHAGVTVASSNRNAPDSFVGKNFAFRPYFQQAIHSAPSTYMALGTTSGKRGVYNSYPIFEPGEDNPIGLAVIKASIERIEKNLDLLPDEILLVTDPNGIIFISNRSEWLYHALRPLTKEKKAQIAASRQFGQGPWPWAGLNFKREHLTSDAQGEEYLLHFRSLDNYTEWRIYYMRSLSAIARNVAGPLIRITGPIVLSLCFLIGIAVFFLYQKASDEILKRREVEGALRESEERYRSLYHQTPAMLHSIDARGQLVSVSNYWTEVLGYERDEVIGEPLTKFLTPESSHYAQTIVFPEFFNNGFCEDIPYRFVKKDGQIIDILLSAIADRDPQDDSVRSLAVSIDVTERNRAVEALRQAKEKLSLYSKDLERQVRKRTQEISSILKYTPDVVYIKDRQGRYVLVNNRFGEIHGMKPEQVRGKTEDEIMAPQVAKQLKANDKYVLEQGRSCQIEESIPLKDGMHTYLAVKFPIYDDQGATTGICGIATDITPLKKAQIQLRRLSAGIMASQEKERAAIARELHDELGQVLTALRMDTVWMRDRLQATDAVAAERALTMCRLIDKNLADVRSMAIRLRPVVLDDLGLVDALEWYSNDFENRTGISCVFEHQPVPVINDTIATAAYRIAQEALTNVVRHADASHVTVALDIHENELQLRVADNGCGFDENGLSESEGLGVAGMRERASLVGGTLAVKSRPQSGTEVYFNVPLERETATANDTCTASR